MDENETKNMYVGAVAEFTEGIGGTLAADILSGDVDLGRKELATLLVEFAGHVEKHDWNIEVLIDMLIKFSNWNTVALTK
jgi:hypothetical protein